MSRRRKLARRARQNPGIPLWLILGGVAVAGVGGYFLYQALQPVPATVGEVQGVDTSMPTTNNTLSLSTLNTLTVPPPEGGTITNVSVSGPLAASNGNYVATATGTATLNISYTDASGQAGSCVATVTIGP